MYVIFSSYVCYICYTLCGIYVHILLSTYVLKFHNLKLEQWSCLFTKVIIKLNSPRSISDAY